MAADSDPVDPVAIVEPVTIAPVTPVPVDSISVEPVPVDSIPVEPVPVEPTPVDSAPIDPVPVDSVPVEPVAVVPTDDSAPVAVPEEEVAAEVVDTSDQWISEVAENLVQNVNNRVKDFVGKLNDKLSTEIPKAIDVIQELLAPLAKTFFGPKLFSDLGYVNNTLSGLSQYVTEGVQTMSDDFHAAVTTNLYELLMRLGCQTVDMEETMKSCDASIAAELELFNNEAEASEVAFEQTVNNFVNIFGEVQSVSNSILKARLVVMNFRNIFAEAEKIQSALESTAQGMSSRIPELSAVLQKCIPGCQ